MLPPGLCLGQGWAQIPLFPVHLELNVNLGSLTQVLCFEHIFDLVLVSALGFDIWAHDNCISPAR
jgi:hypothetical protein